MFTRNSFLKLLGAAALAFSTSAGFAAEKSIGTGPGFKGPLGLQLYSLRGHFTRNVAEGLKLTKDFGFREVELAGTYNLAPDRDGQDNLAELGAGTDPNAPGDAPRIQAVLVRARDVVVRCHGVPGQTYQLERSASLSAPASAWAGVGAPVQAAPGSAVELVDPGAAAAGASGSPRFYRIRLLP